MNKKEMEKKVFPNLNENGDSTTGSSIQYNMKGSLTQHQIITDSSDYNNNILRPETDLDRTRQIMHTQLSDEGLLDRHRSTTSK